MIPRDKSERSPGNGFLVFGDAADDGNLIKCGLRNAGQQGMIVQGPLMQGKIVQCPIVSKTNEVIEIEVAVDLEQQTVTMQLLGETVRTELTRPLRSITHIGYAIHSVTTEFGSIEVDR
jgi:hypothetical protein